MVTHQGLPVRMVQAFPDVSKAKAAVANIFALVDTKPKTIDIDAPGGAPHSEVIALK
jgi:hypothetical protein